VITVTTLPSFKRKQRPRLSLVNIKTLKKL
jgi:hypothetical protein